MTGHPGPEGHGLQDPPRAVQVPLPALPDAEHPVISLTEDECWDLLAGASPGRLCVSVDDQPEIYLVNFMVHDGRILIRTVEGNRLVAIAPGGIVALETDGRSLHSVRSVILKGTARLLGTPGELAGAEALAMQPWDTTRRSVFIEITPSRITGRRIAVADEFRLEH